MSNQKSNRAILYCSLWPEETGEYTLDEQSVELQTYCLLQGLEPIRIVTDVAPYEKGKIRHGFEQLLESVISDEINHIIIKDIGRVCRDSRQAISFLTEAFDPDHVEIHVEEWGFSTGCEMGKNMAKVLKGIWELDVKEVLKEKAQPEESIRSNPLWHKMFGLLQDEKYAESLITALVHARDRIVLTEKEDAAVHGGYDHLNLFRALGYRIKAEKTENTRTVADVLARNWDLIRPHLSVELQALIIRAQTGHSL